LTLLIVWIGCASGQAYDDYDDYYGDEDGSDFSRAQKYSGRLVDVFKSHHHEVNGKLYVVDAKTLLLKDFTYDGQSRDAFFFGGGDAGPNPGGFIIPNEYYRTNVLHRYLNAEFTLTLPPGKTVEDLSWFSVYDIESGKNFGEVTFPPQFQAPAKQRLQSLEGVSNNVGAEEVILLDSKTIVLNYFTYDGRAGDGVHFWVGNGPQPSRKGRVVPNERGYLEPLARYDSQSGKEIRLQLPGNLTVFDINWFSIYDTASSRSLGYVIIPGPDSINVPPALVEVIESSRQTQLPNCEMLHADLRVAWNVFAPQVVIELSGNVDKASEGLDEYLAFGVSNPQGQSKMIGSDVSVAYMDGFRAIVEDYNITAKSLCTSVLNQNKGVCPDIHVAGSQNNQIQTFDREGGVFTVTYRRDLINSQDAGDNSIAEEGPTSIVWAMGRLAHGSLTGPRERGRPQPIRKEPSFHHTYPKQHVQIDFNRKKSANNCWAFVRRTRAMKNRKNHPSLRTEELSSVMDPQIKPWARHRFFDPTQRRFEARLGPAGGFQRGYSALSGLPTTGNVWYINGYMTPELFLQRGRTYTFTVEGGDRPSDPELYHPFVITNDALGGYWRMPKDGSRRLATKIYAGVKYTFRGIPQANAAGKLCLWKHVDSADARLDDIYPSFARFRNSLKLNCGGDRDQATMTVMPNYTWPDTVFYQSFISPYMGGKINIVDDLSRVRHSNYNNSGSNLSSNHITTLVLSIIFILSILSGY